MKSQTLVTGSCVRTMVVAVAALFVIISATHLSAQIVTGTILGNVLDSSGAAVLNAQITVTNQDTGVMRSAASSSAGVYNVPSLPAGTYTIDAKAQGFSAIQIKDVVVVVGSNTGVDLKFQIGQVSQQVTVTEAVPTVDTTSSEVASLMDQVAIQNIPLNARDVQQLAEIQAGVQLDYDDPNGKQLTVGGSRPDDNRYVNEGLDQTWTLGTSPLSTAGVILGVEAVKEFKVLTGEYGAEYGEQGGGVVNTIYKSGTNSFHGSAYEYYRNSVFDARNFFDLATVPPFQRNQFGGSVGGPILKDKTFFFANFEGFRQDLNNTQVGFFPDAQATTGNLPCAALGTTSSACKSGVSGSTYEPITTVSGATAAGIAAIENLFFSGSNPLVPACGPGSAELLGGDARIAAGQPNPAVFPTGLCRQVESPLQTIDDYFGLLKMDHTFSSKNSLSSSYKNEQSSETSPSANYNFGDDIIFHDQAFTLQDTDILSANVVNTARLGVARRLYQYVELAVNGPASLYAVPNPVFPISPIPQPPAITISGGSTAIGYVSNAFVNATNPRSVGYTRGNVSDDVNYLHGKHAFQFGFQYKTWDDNTWIGNSGARGTYTFNSLEQFLQGGPALTFAVLVQPYSDAARGWRQHLIGFYGEDTYKIKTNLTLTLGLRFEYVPGPTEAHDMYSNLPNPETSATWVTNGPYFTTSPNWAPRLGFNWDPFKKGKSSFRGGFGMFYDEIEAEAWYTGSSTQPPYAESVSLSNLMPLPYSQSVLNTYIANNLDPATGLPKIAFSAAMPAHPRTPTKYGYNLSFQQELPDHMSLLIGYVGSQSRFGGRPLNDSDYYPQVQTPGSSANPYCTVVGSISCLFWPGSGLKQSSPAVNPSPAFSTISGVAFDANSSYNSLQFTLQRRMSPGLNANLNYTHSSCETDSVNFIPNQQTNGGASPIYTRDVQSGFSRCSFSASDAGNFSLSYDSPFAHMVSSRLAKVLVEDWQITSITSVSRGVPFEITDGVNVSRAVPTGTGLDRPNIVNGCTAQSAVNPGNPTNYINASCFAPATFGYMGDLGPVALTSPPLWDTDVSLKRKFRLHENKALELGADMFNAFNRANFAVPPAGNRTLYSNAGTSAAPLLIANPTFGQITTTNTNPRQIQLSARFTF